MLSVNVSNIHPQIPPAPPRPDFDEPRHKLAKLREGQSLLDTCTFLSLPHPLLLLHYFFVYTGEESMTKEEYSKMKQELEAYVQFSHNCKIAHFFPSLSPLLSLFHLPSEYLATFKKTVAMHEVFLQRLASHPQLRSDHNYQTFLEFDGDVSLSIAQYACPLYMFLPSPPSSFLPLPLHLLSPLHSSPPPPLSPCS